MLVHVCYLFIIWEQINVIIIQECFINVSTLFVLRILLQYSSFMRHKIASICFKLLLLKLTAEKYNNSHMFEQQTKWEFLLLNTLAQHQYK